MRSIFLSRLIYQTYNGYVMSQFRKIEQDLRAKGAIKWKHAMHLVRLLLSGVSSQALDAMHQSSPCDRISAENILENIHAANWRARRSCPKPDPTCGPVSAGEVLVCLQDSGAGRSLESAAETHLLRCSTFFLDNGITRVILTS